jgi:hypothetical protein
MRNVPPSLVEAECTRPDIYAHQCVMTLRPAHRMQAMAEQGCRYRPYSELYLTVGVGMHDAMLSCYHPDPVTPLTTQLPS